MNTQLLQSLTIWLGASGLFGYISYITLSAGNYIIGGVVTAVALVIISAPFTGRILKEKTDIMSQKAMEWKAGKKNK